jgi:hypothetical protein
MRVLGLVIAAVGLVVLLNLNLMDAASAAILARHGGSMDTNVYLAELAQAAAALRVIGGILLAIGLLRATQPGRASAA